MGQIEPMWSMLGTSWAQVELVLGLVWPMLGLRWLRLGLCWAYLGVCWYNGSMLAYVGPITDRTVQSDSPSKTIGDSPCFLFFCSNSLALETKQQTNTAYHIMPCPDRQTTCPMTLLDFMGTPGSDRFWLGAETRPVKPNLGSFSTAFPVDVPAVDARVEPSSASRSGFLEDTKRRRGRQDTSRMSMSLEYKSPFINVLEDGVEPFSHRVRRWGSSEPFSHPRGAKLAKEVGWKRSLGGWM